MNRTLAIIKPDGVQAGLIGEVIKRIEEDGLRIVAMRMDKLDTRRAEGFYYVHRSKPFFNDLITYMTSGPVVLMVLQGYDVINRWRTLMGATDPKKAA
ncbi:nucleoside-diphosphate kinase, partial [candidate division KSB1 bacterium]